MFGSVLCTSVSRTEILDSAWVRDTHVYPPADVGLNWLNTTARKQSGNMMYTSMMYSTSQKNTYK